MSAFTQGVRDMLKLAASISQLQKGVGRLGAVKVKIKDPGATIGAVVSGRNKNIGPRELTALGGSVATLPGRRNVPKIMLQQHQAIANTLKSKGLPRGTVDQAMQQIKGQQASMTQMKSRKGPVIFTGKGRLTPSHMFSQMTGTKLSPSGKKGVNIGATMHEQFERSAMKGKRPVHYGFGHVNPEVLAKEHNMLARLTGKGSGETRRAMTRAREMSGDSEALNRLLKERFGERAGIAYGTGGKIPKAMRKALRRGPVSPTWQRMPDQML